MAWVKLNRRGRNRKKVDIDWDHAPTVTIGGHVGTVDIFVRPKEAPMPKPRTAQHMFGAMTLSAAGLTAAGQMLPGVNAMPRPIVSADPVLVKDGPNPLEVYLTPRPNRADRRRSRKY